MPIRARHRPRDCVIVRVGAIPERTSRDCLGPYGARTHHRYGPKVLSDGPMRRPTASMAQPRCHPAVSPRLSRCHRSSCAWWRPPFGCRRRFAGSRWPRGRRSSSVASNQPGLAVSDDPGVDRPLRQVAHVAVYGSAHAAHRVGPDGTPVPIGAGCDRPLRWRPSPTASPTSGTRPWCPPGPGAPRTSLGWHRRRDRGRGHRAGRGSDRAGRVVGPGGRPGTERGDLAGRPAPASACHATARRGRRGQAPSWRRARPGSR